MTTRYYEETPCEHGNDGPHQTYIKDRRGNIGAEGPVCPGGSRRELEGVGIIEPLEDGMYKLKAGRYAIIPLPEETE